MKIKTIKQIKFSLIALLTLTNLSWYEPVVAKSQTQTSRSRNASRKPTRSTKKPQIGDRRGRPTRRRGMGSRNDCPATDIPLTALIPENQVGQVVEAKPTFWLFIPYKSSEIPKGEFVLQDENHNDVYRKDFPINKGEGIVGVSLASETSLETNKIYQWYFKLYCEDSESTIPIYVRGWVQRIALQPQQKKQLSRFTSPRQRVAFYVNNGIWYSAFTELAKTCLPNPRNKNIEKGWSQLLGNVGLQDLSNKPIIGKISE
ncbi:MAG: DUF928 domain-containing protein [Cyanobacteriota bacterium]|nr:DUF928 domain-containing protein [Cyanobacteriota bacterium]